MSVASSPGIEKKTLDYAGDVEADLQAAVDSSNEVEKSLIKEELDSTSSGIKIINNDVIAHPDIEEELSVKTKLATTSSNKHVINEEASFIYETGIFKCHECKFRSCYKYVLRKHIKTHRHKLYKCSKCNYSSLKMRSLQKHLVTHMSEKPFKCTKCSYNGSRKLYLDVHMKTHVTNSSFKCSACEYTASQRSTLTKHFNVAHLLLSG